MREVNSCTNKITLKTIVIELKQDYSSTVLNSNLSSWSTVLFSKSLSKHTSVFVFVMFCEARFLEYVAFCTKSSSSWSLFFRLIYRCSSNKIPCLFFVHSFVGNTIAHFFICVMWFQKGNKPFPHLFSFSLSWNWSCKWKNM